MSFIINPYAFAGSSPISFLDSVGATNGVNGPHTTAAIDTTGADLIVLAVAFGDTTTATVSDSKGNTWTSLTDRLGEGPFLDVRVQLHYCISPTVGSGHTFTASAGTNYASIAAAAFSLAAGGFDAETGAGSGVGGDTTMQPGSLTPSSADALLVTACGYIGAATATINSSFTEVEDIDNTGVGGFSVALAYKIQTTATAENPTWSTNVGAERVAAAMASFLHT